MSFKAAELRIGTYYMLFKVVVKSRNARCARNGNERRFFYCGLCVTFADFAFHRSIKHTSLAQYVYLISRKHKLFYFLHDGIDVRNQLQCPFFRVAEKDIVVFCAFIGWGMVGERCVFVFIETDNDPVFVVADIGMNKVIKMREIKLK